MKNRTKEPQKQAACSRRSLLKSAGTGIAGLSLAGMVSAPIEEQVAYATQNVKRSSSPSQLRITDLRIAVVTRAPFRCPLIRIDTNQDISGYGEVRDGASERYALILKSRLLRQNPCNVERIFKRIKQFGHHGRQGGGVSGVEMALWDLVGKAYGVPVYQMLGGQYRDRVRLYADTPDGSVEGLKKRLDQGFTFLKMDCGIRRLFRVPGALTYPTRGTNWRGKHPFTSIQLSDKGAALMAERFAEAREAVGWEVPISSDHFGHISVNSCIKLGKALQPYQLAWLEDMVPWEYTEMLKEIKNAIDVPLLTGEDIYLLDGFKPLIDERAVDMVHPDLATAGGILETKKIGDYAEQHGIAMAMHFAGTPVSFMANLHCAAATENFVALEHHAVDIDWWEDMVTGIEKPLHVDGFARVPEGPGLGIELNLDVVKEHLGRGQELFAPTEEWNRDRSNDRLWS
ncbi:MAG TPA: mandelate racemase/muconate lactonizing enzyme family protein [Sedimentisphaerales bacterium]|nr:mandelate racemase/muconate lactonizing enzyme family protein [Sedimentisphaerales bacterium]